MLKKIYLFDTTLREGIQGTGNFIPLKKRIEVANLAEEIGIDTIQIGYPAASDYEEKAVRTLSEQIGKGTRINVFSGCKERDIRIAGESCRKENSEIELLVSGSDILLEYKRGISREENVEEMLKCIEYAKKLFPNGITVTFEDSGRADLQYLNDLAQKAISHGVTKISIPDTTGYCLPKEYGKIISNIKQVVRNSKKNIKISSHCHNDLGLAVANSLSALENGADEIQTSFLGIGERCGITPVHTLLMALTARSHALKYVQDIDAKKICETSYAVAKIFNREVPKEEPLIGGNAFSTEAGMHQAGMLANPSTYEIIDPYLFNRKREISIGPFSGKNAINEKCVELGFTLSPDELNAVVRVIKSQTSAMIKKDKLIELIKKGIKKGAGKCAQ